MRRQHTLLAAVLAAAVLGPACGATAAPPAPAAATPRTVAGVAEPAPSPVYLPTSLLLSAPPAGVVWALLAGAYLFESTDRGTTWRQRPLPRPDGRATFDELAFTDDRTGWLTQYGSPETQCGAQQVAIWRTTDAGATWERPPVSGLSGPGCKHGLSFVDRTHGYLAASDPNRAPAVYRTADGGSSWSRSAPLPDPPGFTSAPAGDTLTAGRVQAFGPTLLITAARPRQQVDDVFRSTDGGAVWTSLATAPGDVAACVTATRWLLFALPLRETTDSGRSWHPFTSDYSQAAPVAPTLVFADARVGYATVRGDLQRTEDGGAHWTRLRTPGTASS
jgi:photosystem II stability/assembly factor-like uncharacterized protein